MSVTSTAEDCGVDAEEGRLDIRYVRELPARPGEVAPWPAWLSSGTPARAAVEGVGVAGLWAHQAKAAGALHAGRHVVLTTGTASGKSLAYLLPIAVAATSPTAPSPVGAEFSVRS